MAANAEAEDGLNGGRAMLLLTGARGLLAAASFLLLLFVGTALFSRPLENFVRDLMMSTISPFTAPDADRIAIVAITEETIAKFPYRSPIDRGFVAELVNRISQAGPLAIGIDLLFDQPTEPAKDSALVTALANAGAPVFLAYATPRDGLTQAQSEWLSRFAPSAKRGLAVLSADRVDGVVRTAFAGRFEGGFWMPGLAQALAEATGLTPGRVAEPMVYYRTRNGEPYRFVQYPAQFALLAPDDWFRGKIVLIGVDLPIEDRHVTPFAALNGAAAGSLPGVVIHAHSLARQLSGDRILEGGFAAGLLLTVLAGSACAWIAWRPISILLKPAAVIAVLGAGWVAGALAFRFGAVQVPLVAPTLISLGLAAISGFVAWRRDQREKQFVLQAFSQYVSPGVVETLVKNPSLLRLGGERRAVTCVFTDLEGFTRFSEALQPEVLASVLNEYLDAICDEFIRHGATIDKVIGDAVVGFFGAPALQHDQASRAVALALAIGERSRAMQASIARQGLVLGATRTGIHCGDAIVGNFGGSRFFDYTAIGDTVNTAARLEGANKYIGTLNCISGMVAQNAGQHLLRPSGTLFLKGKTAGRDTFEALPDIQENRTMVDAYDEAYAKLAAAEEGASEAFAVLSARYPDDRLIAFHCSRLAAGERGVSIHLSEK
jgi:adenylate cyclase